MGVNSDAGDALAAVRAGRTLTQRPGPRVLIQDPGYFHDLGGGGRQYQQGRFDAHGLAERLAATVPTVEVAKRVADYNLSEWDCLVTGEPATNFQSETVSTTGYSDNRTRFFWWRQRYPDTLCVICVTTPGPLLPMDARPPSASKQIELPNVAIVRDAEKVGRHITRVDGLPDYLSAVVTSQLVPVASTRNSHLSFRRAVSQEASTPTDWSYSLPLRPFLLGPEDVYLAGSYERNDIASFWLLPDDLPDLFPWVVAALREWHDLYPDRFPAQPEWQGGTAWRSHAETAIANERQAVIQSYKQTLDALQSELDVLDGRAANARTASDQFHRALSSAPTVICWPRPWPAHWPRSGSTWSTWMNTGPKATVAKT